MVSPGRVSTRCSCPARVIEHRPGVVERGLDTGCWDKSIAPTTGKISSACDRVQRRMLGGGKVIRVQLWLVREPVVTVAVYMLDWSSGESHRG